MNEEMNEFLQARFGSDCFDRVTTKSGVPWTDLVSDIWTQLTQNALQRDPPSVHIVNTLSIFPVSIEKDSELHLIYNQALESFIFNLTSYVVSPPHGDLVKIGLYKIAAQEFLLTGQASNAAACCAITALLMADQINVDAMHLHASRTPEFHRTISDSAYAQVIFVVGHELMHTAFRVFPESDVARTSVRTLIDSMLGSAVLPDLELLQNGPHRLSKSIREEFVEFMFRRVVDPTSLSRDELISVHLPEMYRKFHALMSELRSHPTIDEESVCDLMGAIVTTNVLTSNGWDLNVALGAPFIALRHLDLKRRINEIVIDSKGGRRAFGPTPLSVQIEFRQHILRASLIRYWRSSYSGLSVIEQENYISIMSEEAKRFGDLYEELVPRESILGLDVEVLRRFVRDVPLIGKLASSFERDRAAMKAFVGRLA